MPWRTATSRAPSNIGRGEQSSSPTPPVSSSSPGPSPQGHVASVSVTRPQELSRPRTLPPNFRRMPGSIEPRPGSQHLPHATRPPPRQPPGYRNNHPLHVMARERARTSSSRHEPTAGSSMPPLVPDTAQALQYTQTSFQTIPTSPSVWKIVHSFRRSVDGSLTLTSRDTPSESALSGPPSSAIVSSHDGSGGPLLDTLCGVTGPASSDSEVMSDTEVEVEVEDELVARLAMGRRLRRREVSETHLVSALASADGKRRRI
ncbi:hypothetical protein P7C70_g7134, partial [Phenoliferia sp. Uapishka_3]